MQVRFQRISADVKEASFRLYRADNRGEVLATHGVPPYRAGIAETGSLGGSTAEESTEIYKRSFIEPRQDVIEDVITRHIIRGGFQVEGWALELAEIDNADEMHEMELQVMLLQNGAMDAQELCDL